MSVRFELTAECLAERASRGPRYTSYPPATEIRAIAPERVTQELARIAADGTPIGLYAHIPFCVSLCAYCGCNVIPTRDTTRGDAYVDQLITELALLSEQLSGNPTTEVSLGGGSPNFLEPAAIRRLMAGVRRYFAPLQDARMSVELDPRRTTASQLYAFREMGFGTMSVGVQDFAAPVQDAIRRHQSAVQTKWLIDRARHEGFTDINVDIVYGLPKQSDESFADTIDTIIDLAPDRIALFGYAHLPSKLPHQILVERAGRVLDRYERATLLLLAIDKLTAAGYVHLGLDHFAKPSSRLARAAAEHRMIRNFQGYVEHRADVILGVGVTAISQTPRLIWQNTNELAPWRDALLAGRLPSERGIPLDRDDQLRRDVIGKLMCDGEVALNELGRTYGVDAKEYFAPELRQLIELQDLASFDGATIRTTSMGRLLVRNVCMVFDRYFQPGGETRFSSTI
jgi:oxygen-independent coproporphyrinogen-3 oxidase